MKHIVRYLLEGDGSVPLFIEDGGYFKSSEELVGLSVDDAKRHLPDTVHKLTRAELYTRVFGLAPRNEEGDLLTEEESDDLVDAFLVSKGKSDLA